jgi:hypothetical protein
LSQIPPIGPILPTPPIHKPFTVYNLAGESLHGMEEVIGSIPIRSTKFFQAFRRSPFFIFRSILAANIKTFVPEGFELMFCLCSEDSFPSLVVAGGVAEQEFDLLQVPAILPAELGASQILPRSRPSFPLAGFSHFLFVRSGPDRYAK